MPQTIVWPGFRDSCTTLSTLRDNPSVESRSARDSFRHSRAADRPCSRSVVHVEGYAVEAASTFPAGHIRAAPAAARPTSGFITAEKAPGAAKKHHPSPDWAPVPIHRQQIPEIAIFETRKAPEHISTLIVGKRNQIVVGGLSEIHIERATHGRIVSGIASALGRGSWCGLPTETFRRNAGYRARFVELQVPSVRISILVARCHTLGSATQFRRRW